MKVSKEIIIEKTRHLSKLINAHNITIQYKKLHNDLQGDKKSIDLLSQLVILGQETSEKLNRGELPTAESTWENITLKEELEKNELVKKYILAQKEYLELITSITDRIKNPQ